MSKHINMADARAKMKGVKSKKKGKAKAKLSEEEGKRLLKLAAPGLPDISHLQSWPMR